MEEAERDARLAQLTADMAWLRRLCRALLRNDEAADLANDRTGDYCNEED